MRPEQAGIQDGEPIWTGGESSDRNMSQFCAVLVQVFSLYASRRNECMLGGASEVKKEITDDNKSNKERGGNQNHLTCF